MKKIILTLLLPLWGLGGFAQILFADYSDPDVCQGPEGDYWLTASSFQETPGLPILHSTDLENWECVNFALHKLIPEEVYNKVQHGKGVWAPSIRFHNGEFYIYWGDPDFGIFMVHSKDPRGQWSEPVWVMKAKGIIDTTPLWDDDGKCYLVNGWAGSRCGFNSVITIRELSSDGTKVIGEPKMVYDGISEGTSTGSAQVNHTIEGPKLYKQNGYYYILAPAGGVEKGWEVALRSKSIYGPYESKIVFNKDGIHQGGWVSFGNSGTQGAFICFQDRGVYGRILHLLDVRMKDGWPMMSQIKNEKLKIKNHSAHEGYAWHSNYQDFYGFQGNGFTRVYGEYHDGGLNFWDVSNLYLKKFEGETFCDTLNTVISAKADGQQAGFIIMGRSYCRIAVELQEEKATEGSKVVSGDAKFVLKEIVNNNADGLSPQQGSAALDSNKKGYEDPAKTKIFATLKAKRVEAGANPLYQTDIKFAIKCNKGGQCYVKYSVDGKTWVECPTPFQARQGKWIGAKYGVFAISRPGVERNYIDLINK